MSFIDELLTFSDLPSWVNSRLSLVADEISNKKFEFYIQQLKQNPYDMDKNYGTAYFLTDDELIVGNFRMSNITINKFKLVNLLEIHKNIETSTEDNFYSKDVRYNSVVLKFDKEKSVSLTPPTITDNINYGKYINLISKL
ncbi:MULTISPECIES: hypothetical protein [Pelosinus]|uniref:YokE-like PH domain-containing protein n=1 Tax=Pelosinus fermentans B4 TaxID=1149862 RepID=I9LJX1_9FIRM|nr:MULTISPECIES: hypothetical protein [Pelosinus]EIW20726.1 hypothetical protein FB4_1938 [Pelosinus fermentans B4]EIW25429.1 hypothetical protein FA11_2588 [Pelosinus fermentans A11]OAM93689.1 hypothetical protein FR7_01706 [Pelosinus fermentans DSM 17108]SDQ86670.1 hypothetical protein SAMN04515679_1792 [Pelosinus fermentans]